MNGTGNVGHLANQPEIHREAVGAERTINEMLATPFRRRREWISPRTRRRLPALVFGSIIGWLAVAIFVSSYQAARTALADEESEANAIEYAPRPLPPEWQWTGRPTVDVEGMYYRRDNSRGLDWIRNNGRR